MSQIYTGAVENAFPGTVLPRSRERFSQRAFDDPIRIGLHSAHSSWRSSASPPRGSFRGSMPRVYAPSARAPPPPHRRAAASPRARSRFPATSKTLADGLPARARRRLPRLAAAARRSRRARPAMPPRPHPLRTRAAPLGPLPPPFPPPRVSSPASSEGCAVAWLRTRTSPSSSAPR